MSEFDVLTTDYLNSIKEDIDRVDEIFDHDQGLTDDGHREVFRIIHSIKGGAGSHELSFIGAICHNFEDFISNYLTETTAREDPEKIKHAKAYVALLRNVANDYSSGTTSNLMRHAESLSALRSNVETKMDYKGHILVVDSTNTMANIIKTGLNQVGYDCTLVKNGLSAFNRLVTDKYDGLITSLNLEVLDGVSLVNALKATSNINGNIPVIVVSASKNIKERFTKSNRPDHIIEKDTELINNIIKTVDSWFEHKHKPSEETLDNAPKKILYVEDDPRMQKLFRLAMKKHPDVSVEITDDQNKAKEIVKDFNPDVVLLDNFLRGYTGKDVFEDILEYKKPCIFLTASEASVEVDKLKEHKEFIGIITKPFRPSSIYSQIAMFYKEK